MTSPTYRALVGGATQGSGRAVAEALAVQDCALPLLARDEARLRVAVAALPPAPGATPHDFLVAGFARPEGVGNVVGDYLAQHPAGFQILVNNTGGPAGGPILAASADELRAAFEQHVIVNQLLARAVVPGMRAAGYGRIINGISTSVRIPIAGLGVSNTVRGAVASWAKTLAGELGGPITVNSVLPGATLTPRHHSLIEKRVAQTGQSVEEGEAARRRAIPAGRFGQAAEVAAMAFLASPAAACVNGGRLPVDGGRTGRL